ncbi:hypothetical protein M1373_03410 [Candidatus Marsarchaeota archaeon]|nr:hypothetical protein [Candidatus Marsarchaeota archaeon]MCL5404793.1 hypothetical protein [Candidatus Marsarchaeota archaeon]
MPVELKNRETARKETKNTISDRSEIENAQRLADRIIYLKNHNIKKYEDGASEAVLDNVKIWLSWIAKVNKGSLHELEMLKAAASSSNFLNMKEEHVRDYGVLDHIIRLEERKIDLRDPAANFMVAIRDQDDLIRTLALMKEEYKGTTIGKLAAHAIDVETKIKNTISNKLDDLMEHSMR